MTHSTVLICANACGFYLPLTCILTVKHLNGEKGKYHLSTIMRNWLDFSHSLNDHRQHWGSVDHTLRTPALHTLISAYLSLLFPHWLAWGAPWSTPGDKNSRASGLFVRWPQEVLGRDGESGKRKNGNQCMMYSWPNYPCRQLGLRPAGNC